jgi:hypothetical protein
MGLLRTIFNGPKISGVEKVFINLCKGFDELNINYTKNLSFKKIKPGEPVIVLGTGEHALQGYNQPNPIIAGIGLMTHPAEWPDLFKQYPVVKYLQHSKWANDIYKPYFGAANCELWPAGIDTDRWSPDQNLSKKFDFLIYNKIRCNHTQVYEILRNPIINKLEGLGLSYKEIVYGQYNEVEYFHLLQQCRAMIFLCEHESQGFACCEAMSMNVPVLAWDQGYWLDPNRFEWNDPIVVATSVPFFDENCGMIFKDIEDFENKINAFWQGIKHNNFNPRDYILKTLTLKKSAERMIQIIENIF